MTRTVGGLVNEAQQALSHAGLDRLEWTWGELMSVRQTRSGLVFGQLKSGSGRIRFVCVDRSIGYRLAQHHLGWCPGLWARWDIRIVIHPRHGFQAQIHDVDLESLVVHEPRHGRDAVISGVSQACSGST